MLTATNHKDPNSFTQQEATGEEHCRKHLDKATKPYRGHRGRSKVRGWREVSPGKKTLVEICGKVRGKEGSALWFRS